VRPDEAGHQKRQQRQRAVLRRVRAGVAGVRAPVEGADSVIPQVHHLAEALLDLQSLRVIAAVQAQHSAKVCEACVGLRDDVLAVDDIRQVHQRVLRLQLRLLVEPVAGVPATALLGLRVVADGLPARIARRGERPDDLRAAAAGGARGSGWRRELTS
jgi:hypothetical protein